MPNDHRTCPGDLSDQNEAEWTRIYQHLRQTVVELSRIRQTDKRVITKQGLKKL